MGVKETKCQYCSYSGIKAFFDEWCYNKRGVESESCGLISVDAQGNVML